MKKIYRDFNYNYFHCEAVNEFTDVEVIVEEIPDTIGAPVFHSVKCSWASENGCRNARKCFAYQHILEEEY